MPSVLVTGANRGLGLEFVRQYGANGWRVFAACRVPDRASDLQELAAASNGKTSVHPLDVSDRSAVAALAATLGDPIDILINNAGRVEACDDGFGNINYDKWDDILRTNLFGPAWVTHALAPNVARSERKIVAMMTSGLGSLTENAAGNRNPAGRLYIYRSSKAALNMLVSKLAADLRERGVTVIAMGPGHVQTDMGGPTAKLKPPESIAGLRKMLDERRQEDTGRYFFYTGEEQPW